ncbi:MAG: GNAT family N-acetyltransferase [bacterium]
MIVRLKEDMVSEVIKIFEGLTHYFNPLGIQRLKNDISEYFAKPPSVELAGFFVYVNDNGEILGLIGYKRLLYHKEYEITWIATRNDCQRKGIGRELISHLEIFLSNYQLELLTATIPDRPVSREFYYKMGFRSINRFLNGEGERLVYQKRFGPLADICQEFVANYLRRKRLKEIKKKKG